MVAQAWSGPGLGTADDCDVGEEVSRDEDVYGREWRDDDEDVRVGEGGERERWFFFV